VADLEAAVRAVAAGDRAAFGAVVAETTPRLLRLVARMIGNVEEAEDVLQDGYIRAFDALIDGRFDGRSGAFTWIYRVVANVALDAMRSRKRRRARFTDEGAAPEPRDEGEGGEDRIAARAALRELGDLLDALPADQRTALVLKELEGLSSTEIAEVMGSSVGAVEQRLVRARATLRTRSHRD
jgi:RNA polymerase sigma-70 factor (ECF subfamily)